MFWKELSSAEKWAVLANAKKILSGGRLPEAPGGQLRGAIVLALREKGWHASAYGSERERSVTIEIGRANQFKAAAASDIEDWARGKRPEEIVAAIDRAIEYLKP